MVFRFSGVLLPALLVQSAHGYLRVPPLFGDNMVLQVGKSTPVFGYATPGHRVAVWYGGRSAGTSADSEGRWRAAIDVAPQVAPGDLVVTSDGERLVLKNVLAGEVWLCSGQSNMEWSYHSAKLAGQSVQVGNLSRPNLRLFQVRRAFSNDPRFEVQGKWVVSSPAAVNDFSLLGYLFGAALQDRLGGAVGLIESDWGGTPAESWTPRSALTGSLASLLSGPATAIPTGAGSPGTPKPERAPGVLYNAMIHPLICFGFRGVAWYQGESNVGRAAEYRDLFPAMIQSWRAAASRDFPFLFVQLANYGSKEGPGGAQWAELRQAQLAALKLDHVDIATAVDLSRDGSIHDVRREDLAVRLVWVALNKVYGRTSAFTGPAFKQALFEGSCARVQFEGKLNGLMIRNGNGLSGFEVAGADRIWYPAFARIESGDVIVTNSKVAAPVAVRYGWGDDPTLSLYNSAGLPVLPFRTDSWGN